MTNEINLDKLKTLLVLARNQVNSELNLDRKKKIKFEETQYFDLLSFQSLFNCCAEEGSQTMNILDEVPTSDALLQQIKKLKYNEIEEQFNKLFKKQFYKQFPKAKKKKPKTIAIIDVHEQETYSKKKKTNENIRGGKHKNGTNYFFKYLTIQILYKNKVSTLGVKFFSKKYTQHKLVDALIKHVLKFVRIKVLLLDRGFRDVKILNHLEYRRVSMLMPRIKDKKSAKFFEELKETQFKCARYWLKNPEGEYADVKLLMVRLPNGKEIGFYTTLNSIWLHSYKYYLQLYAKRWNIETGYKLQNQFLPKTTSINKHIRYFYFCYAVAMHNLWNLIKSISKLGKLFTVVKMKVILLLFWITTHIPKNR